MLSGQSAALAGGTTHHIDFVLPVEHDLLRGLESWKVSHVGKEIANKDDDANPSTRLPLCEQPQGILWAKSLAQWAQYCPF